ncbi:ATP-dependent helicase [Elysia marginata]|uniref:ATP-dependent DNA helicase n=1 Tax=Elysia marginata TaxID=1093978 RepID=A0AAV4HBL4_9GAST|nr:ATP-dependent helicase [Elysia marginata]
MIHGPCGNINPTSPCMKDEKCYKKFPMPFQSRTEIGNDSYPKYKRGSPENDGNSAVKRLLWTAVKGPTSFKSLRCFRGIEQATYREACIAHGLLEQDNAHQMTLQEASVRHHPQSLRSLFAVLLVHAQPTNPKELWNEFEFPLCEDFIHQSVSRDKAKNLALIHIENMVLSMNGEALETFGLPKTDRDAPARWGIEAEYNIQHEQETVQQNRQMLTPEQTHVYNSITQSIDHNTGGIYFLDAPGGCGKPFLIKTLLAPQRSQGRIAIATASSGLAATLLPGGRMVHSTFKVPLNVTNTDQPMCSMKKGTALARLIQNAAVLIIDEVPMLHKRVIEALDRTFQDIRSSKAVIGGLLTLMCGDFRQILPVIPQGTRANIVNASLKK